MRVLLITPDFPPVLRSTSRLFSELAQDLSASGHRVTVLTRVPTRDLPTPENGIQNGSASKDTLETIRVKRVKSLPVPRGLPMARALEQVWMAFAFLIRGLGLRRHEAIVVYSPPMPMGLTGYMLARLWRGAVVMNVQDLYPQSVIDLGLLRNRLLIRLASALEKLLYRKVDAITVHSEGNLHYVVAKGAPPHRVHVVPNWVDLGSVRPGPRLNGWRAAQRLDRAFIASFAGNMGFAQGLEDVVHVAESLKEHGDLVFVLAGDGAFRGRLQKTVAEKGLGNVQFLPFQGRQAYLELLQASDICLVGLHKNLKTPVVPGKLQTIMAAGRPVVCWANPASDAKRIIEESGCGLFVSAGDVVGLTQALLTIYANRGLGETMGQKGRCYAERHFERKRCTGAYISLLEELNPKNKPSVKRK